MAPTQQQTTPTTSKSTMALQFGKQQATSTPNSHRQVASAHSRTSVEAISSFPGNTHQKKSSSAHPRLQGPTQADLSLDQSTQDGAPDLAVFVQDLLEQMHTRFSDMEVSVTKKLDVMGKNIDELDSNISELMKEAGLEPPSLTADGPKQTNDQKERMEDHGITPLS